MLQIFLKKEFLKPLTFLLYILLILCLSSHPPFPQTKLLTNFMHILSCFYIFIMCVLRQKSFYINAFIKHILHIHYIQFHTPKQNLLAINNIIITNNYKAAPVLKTLHLLTHLIFIIVRLVTFSYSPHFTDEKNEAQRD